MFLSSVIIVHTILLIVGLVEDCSTSSPINYDFESIEEYKNFVERVKEGDNNLLNKKEIEALVELSHILTRQEVCSPTKIDQLVDYHKKHLQQDKIFKRAKPTSSRFFTHYAIQIAYTCKKKLIRNLEIAIAELRDRSKVFDEAKEKVFNEEPLVKSNFKLIEEQADDPLYANVKPRDDVESTFSEYREALVQLKQPEDILVFDRDDCLESKSRETRVSSDKLQTFFKPALMCHQLHRFYGGSLLSIARLANLGYAAYDEELDSQILSSTMIKDWLVAVQVCEPMLYMYAKETKDDWSIIDTCAPKVPAIETVTYDDELEDIGLDKMKEMISKSVATRKRAKKLMKSALKKMAKANLFKQLNSGVKKKSIFSKSLAQLTSQYVSYSVVSHSSITARSFQNFSLNLKGNLMDNSNMLQSQLSEKESLDVLMTVISIDKQASKDVDQLERNEELDSSVSFFDPLSMMVSTLTVLLIMVSFEWLFFVVLSLAARLCHRLYFNFDNILTFPPKLLSWADADFAKFNDMVEKMDEDDFFDYDQLTGDEQQQRNLLEQVFGRPPPLLYRD